MENSIYTGLSRQIALAEKMDIIANNVANMSTPGYRAQNMVFKEYINRPPRSEGVENPKDPLSMVMDYGQYQDTEIGPIQQTGNPLDVALQGPGWFGVQTANGVQYTRAGNFTLNGQGELVTSSGDKVANGGGGTITVPSEAKEIKIDRTGKIFTDQGEIGSLMVMTFPSDQDLKAQGNGLYSSPTAGIPSEDTKVMQGMLEGSNVKPVLEMTRMIDVARNYEATQRMLQNEHDRQRTMIERLVRTGS